MARSAQPDRGRQAVENREGTPGRAEHRSLEPVRFACTRRDNGQLDAEV